MDIKGEAVVTDEESFNCFDINTYYNLLVMKGLPVIIVTNYLGIPIHVSVAQGYVLETSYDDLRKVTVYQWDDRKC